MRPDGERRAAGGVRGMALRWAIGTIELVLVTALAVAGPLLAHTFLSVRAQTLSATQEFLRLIAPDCAPDLAARDRSALEAWARRLAERQDIDWVRFADMEDRPLAQAGFTDAKRDDGMIRIPVRLGGGTDGDASAGRPVGWIIADPSWTTQRQQTLAAAGTAAGGFVLASALAALLVLEWVRRTLRPVRDLALAAERVAEGDLREPVPVRSLDELGRVAIAFNRMIDQLRRSRERLVSREQMSTGIIFAAQDAIVVMDPQRRITALNPKAETLIGYSLADVRGKKVDTLFADSEALERLRETVRSGQAVPEFETELVARSGDRVPVNLSLGALEGSDGEAAAFVAVARDTRRVRELLSSLRDANKKLREAQSQIMRTAKLAAVGQIAAGVAHELNNPLGGILGFAQVARARLKREEAVAPEDLDNYLARVEQAVLRCRRIVEKLRRFAFSEKVAVDRLDLNEVVRDTLDLMATRGDAAHVDIQTSLWPDSVEVMGDDRQLQQALMNVLVNACQAVSPPDARIEIVTAVGADGSRPIGTVTVRDNGGGILPRNLSQVFDPFFTTQPPGYGEGLGLSVAYAIVRDHGGRIDIESRERVGTIVRFELPLAPEADGAARAELQEGHTTA